MPARAGVVHLLEIVRRIKTPEEAALAVDTAQKFALHRARRGQHSALSPELTAWIVRVRGGALTGWLGLHAERKRSARTIGYCMRM